MEVWDDEPDKKVDLNDHFMIAILDTVSAVNESEPMIIEGVNSIGNLKIAYYNFTTDDQLHVVPSFSSADICTTTITSSPSIRKTYILYMFIVFAWVYQRHRPFFIVHTEHLARHIEHYIYRMQYRTLHL